MTSKTIKIPDYVVVNCAKVHPDNVCEHCRKRNKCTVYRNDVCKELADSLANEITKSIEIAILSEMMKNDNEPIIDIQNVGQHDADNSFLLDKSIKNQYNQWKTSHPGVRSNWCLSRTFENRRKEI